MNRKVLITGATGFLGSAIAVELAQHSPTVDLLFLVRGDSNIEGRNRLAEAMRKQGATQDILSKLSPEQILCSDLGSTVSFTEDTRLSGVTHIINCAAVPSFADKPAIRRVNVDDTLTFARSVAQLPNVEQFLQIGTAMISGNTSSQIIHEDAYPTPTAHHLVPYTESKAEAERLLPEALGNVPLF